MVAVGQNKTGQCDVSDWYDIVAVAAGCAHTIGLKSDGTVITVGDRTMWCKRLVRYPTARYLSHTK